VLEDELEVDRDSYEEQPKKSRRSRRGGPEEPMPIDRRVSAHAPACHCDQNRGLSRPSDGKDREAAGLEQLETSGKPAIPASAPVTSSIWVYIEHGLAGVPERGRFAGAPNDSPSPGVKERIIGDRLALRGHHRWPGRGAEYRPAAGDLGRVRRTRGLAFGDAPKFDTWPPPR
jgi:hypothetical protein